MRLLGASLILISSLLVGRSIRGGYAERAATLTALRSLIEHIRERAALTLEPIGRACASFHTENAGIARLAELIAESELPQRGYLRWEERETLAPDVRSRLDGFFAAVGRADLTAELARMDELGGFLSSAERDARDALFRDGRVAVAVSVAVGLGIGILII